MRIELSGRNPTPSTTETSVLDLHAAAKAAFVVKCVPAIAECFAGRCRNDTVSVHWVETKRSFIVKRSIENAMLVVVR